MMRCAASLPPIVGRIAPAMIVSGMRAVSALDASATARSKPATRWKRLRARRTNAGRSQNVSVRRTRSRSIRGLVSIRGGRSSPAQGSPWSVSRRVPSPVGGRTRGRASPSAVVPAPGGTWTHPCRPATPGATLAAMSGNTASTDQTAAAQAAAATRRILAPLALAQFICSFAGSNMNVMINDISADLDTTVKGVQTAITLFLLIMAILMIPCSKLTDRWGRKRCFTMGLTLYGVGALLSAAAPGIGVLIVGNSVLEGVGTALLIPPVYILATLWFKDMTRRAWAFGVISGLGGIGAAAGPLIGGLITTAHSWRAGVLFQAAVVALIVLLSRRVEDPLPADPTRPLDTVGGVLTAGGMVVVVFGIP